MPVHSDGYIQQRARRRVRLSGPRVLALVILALSVLLLVIVAAYRVTGAPSRGAVRAVAAMWVALAIGHYAEVTTLFEMLRPKL